MAIPALHAAKFMCESSGWQVSNLVLQKLMYIAHMFHLGQFDQPLINGTFEAWDYGPVQPTVYHAVKVFGSAPVQNIFSRVPELAPGTEANLLKQTVENLSHAKPGLLVEITHWQNGAWAKHYQPGSRGITIPDKDILEEYKQRSKKNV